MPGIELFSVWGDDSEWSNLIFWDDLDMHHVLDNVRLYLGIRIARACWGPATKLYVHCERREPCSQVNPPDQECLRSSTYCRWTQPLSSRVTHTK